MDRVVADSCSVGLYHTGGLSTPSQVMMDMPALTNPVHADGDPVIRLSNDVVTWRCNTLMTAFGLKAGNSTLDTGDYGEITRRIPELMGEYYAVFEQAA